MSETYKSTNEDQPDKVSGRRSDGSRQCVMSDEDKGHNQEMLEEVSGRKKDRNGFEQPGTPSDQKEIERIKHDMRRLSEMLDQRNKEIERSTDKGERLTEELKKRNERISSLTSMLADAEKHRQEKDELIFRFENDHTGLQHLLKDKSEEVVRSKDEVKKLIEELAERDEHIDRSKDEVKKLTKELADRDERIDRSKDDVKKLNKELAERDERNDRSTDAVEKLIEELTESKDEVKKLTQELTESKDEVKKLTEELTESTDEVKNVIEELTESKGEVNELTEELTTSKDKVKKLTEDLEQRDERIKRSKNEVKKLTEELAESKDEVKKLTKELAGRDKLIVRLQTDNNGLNASLIDNIERLQNDKDALKASLDENIDRFSVECEKYRHDLQEKDTQIETLIGQTKMKAVQYQSLEELNDSLGCRHGQLEAEYQNLKTDYDSAKRKIKEKTELIKRMGNDNGKRIAEKDRLNNRLAAEKKQELTRLAQKKDEEIKRWESANGKLFTDKKKLKERHEAENRQELTQLTQKKDDEIKRQKSKYEGRVSTITAERDNLTRQQRESANANATLEANIQKLTEDGNEYMTRLSQIASQRLTANNPNIADLSDENRPTKLAEQFSELYDNEWTDAFNAVQGPDDRSKIVLLKKVLKRTCEICWEVRETQVNWIDSITFQTTACDVDTVTTSANPYRNDETDDDTVAPPANPTTRDIETHTHYTESEKKTDDDTGAQSQNPTTRENEPQTLLSESEKQTNVDTVTMSPKSTTRDNGTENGTSESEKNTVRDIHQGGKDKKNDCCKDKETQTKRQIQMPIKIDESIRAEAITKLREMRQKMSSHIFPVILEVLPMILASEFGMELNEHIKKYLESCVRFCWLMGLQMPPVHIKFEDDREGNIKFVKQMYREYMKRGNFIDFVVWPPLQIQEKGTLLLKGVAQGK